MMTENGRVKTLEGIDQNIKDFVEKNSRGVIPVASWLYHALNNLPLCVLQNEKWKYIASTFNILTEDKTGYELVEPISLDPGNGFLKYGFQTADHRLASHAMPCTIQTATNNMREGGGRTLWQVSGSHKKFLIGEDTTDIRGFSVGSSVERFDDPLYPILIKIGLVQSLKAAGRRAGFHKIALSVGIRVPEMIVNEKGEQQIEQGVKEALAQLKDRGRPFTILETGPNGETQEWTIAIACIFPTIQPMGSYFLWSRNLICDPAQDEYSSVGILDLGTGDMGWAEARTRKGKLHLLGDVIGTGAIELARAVHKATRSAFPELDFTETDAQQAVVSNSLEVGGKLWPLYGSQVRDGQPKSKTEYKIEQIREIYYEAIESLMVNANTKLQTANLFLLITGGSIKNPLIDQKILNRLKTLERSQDQFLVLPPEIAAQANALGLYVYLYWQLLRLQAPTMAR